MRRALRACPVSRNVFAPLPLPTVRHFYRVKIRKFPRFVSISISLHTYIYVYIFLTRNSSESFERIEGVENRSGRLKKRNFAGKEEKKRKIFHRYLTFNICPILDNNIANERKD